LLCNAPKGAGEKLAILLNGQENKIIYITGLSQNWYLKKDQVSQRNKKTLSQYSSTEFGGPKFKWEPGY
jgi:hypothetical protein